MPVLAVFDAEGNWRDTHVCDGWINEHLARQGVAWGREAAPEGQRILESAALVYLPTQDGYLGLLFEAGEWVALPVDKPHFFDAGEAVSFDGLPAALPLFEAFVEQVLSLTGNNADDDA
jgi:1,2-dihydroxy-3-keto-5-methylthiopentene dioxygenase